MYIPSFNAVDDESTIRAMVAGISTAELITTGTDGYPLSTLLPIIWRQDTVIAHMARANPHWRQIGEDQPALLVCAAPQTYISPSWYAAKAEHGRVVPTWNYSAVHLTGRAQVHDDVEWLRTAVTELTELHEGARQRPWAVTDAPADYVEGQLRGIVGVELLIERVEAKAKLSQNRSEADQAGAVDGLRAESTATAGEIADWMEHRAFS